MSPETQVKIKKRGWGFLRWTWRLTYFSAIAGLVYVGYGVYLSKNPIDQEDPDPTKKTLVVLGMRLLVCHGHNEPN